MARLEEINLHVNNPWFTGESSIITYNLNELEILLQRKKNTKTAKRFFQMILKRYNFIPRVIITNKLRSYAAAKKAILKKVEHRQHKGL